MRAAGFEPAIRVSPSLAVQDGGGSGVQRGDCPPVRFLFRHARYKIFDCQRTGASASTLVLMSIVTRSLDSSAG